MFIENSPITINTLAQYSIFLDISSNNLKSFDYENKKYKNYSRSINIFASKNHISSINLYGDRWTTLEQFKLDLSGNEFKSLEKYEINTIELLTNNSNKFEINFENNPWVCNDEFARMKVQLKNNIKQIDKLKCKNVDTRNSTHETLVVMIIIGSLLVLTCIGLIVYRKLIKLMRNSDVHAIRYSTATNRSFFN